VNAGRIASVQSAARGRRGYRRLVWVGCIGGCFLGLLRRCDSMLQLDHREGEVYCVESSKVRCDPGFTLKD
jgi:hypothetical protein